MRATTITPDVLITALLKLDLIVDLLMDDIARKPLDTLILLRM